MIDEIRVPPLPSEAVDFNALHDALDKGDSPELAAAKAVASGRGIDLDVGASLKGKSKADLIKIAEKDAVVLPQDATVADIIEAIEGKRIADLLGPVAYVAEPLQSGVDVPPADPADPPVGDDAK